MKSVSRLIDRKLGIFFYKSNDKIMDSQIIILYTDASCKQFSGLNCADNQNNKKTRRLWNKELRM